MQKLTLCLAILSFLGCGGPISTFPLDAARVDAAQQDGGLDALGGACEYTMTYGTCTFTSATEFTFTPDGASSPTTTGSISEDPNAQFCSPSTGISLSCTQRLETKGTCTPTLYSICPTPLD